MRAASISNIITKAKLSGYEVGRIMLQSLMHGLKQVYEEHKENPDMLFTNNEARYFQDQLTDSYDIQIYNSCRRLQEYITKISDLATIWAKDIEITSFHLYTLMNYEMKCEALKLKLLLYKGNKAYTNTIAEIEDSIINTVKKDFDDTDVGELVLRKVMQFKELMKEWLLLETTIKLVSERMDLPDIMILVQENPVYRVELVNSFIKDLQFLSPENRVSKALFANGIGHYTPDDEVPKNLDVIDIEELKPKKENIERAKAKIQDLRFFKDGNFDLHRIVRGEL